jgi:prevent-host-death family protein
MKFSEQIKPISELKARAPELFKQLDETRAPMVITQHGKARAVLQDIASYEETQETLALLKILAMSERSVAKGKGQSVRAAFKDIRRRVKKK